MKKFFEKYQSYMMGPIIYRTFVRLLIGAVVCLLWVKYGNTSGYFTVLDYPFFVLGVFYLGLLWMDFLKLDGVGGNLVNAKQAIGILFKRHKKEKNYKGISDYANQERGEGAEEFNNLSDREKLLCSMTANLFAGLIFLIPSIVAISL